MSQAGQKQDLILAWLSNSAGSTIDPIRIMKAMFLLSMESPEEWLPSEGRFEFVPYNWGPFSRDVYHVLDELRELGMVRFVQSPGKNWTSYELTDSGMEHAKESSSRFSSEMQSYIKAVNTYVMNQPFADLLSAIYKKYPDFASKSLFAGGAQ